MDRSTSYLANVKQVDNGYTLEFIDYGSPGIGNKISLVFSSYADLCKELIALIENQVANQT